MFAFTLTLISYSSFLSKDGYVVTVMHPLVLFMSNTPSLPGRRQTIKTPNRRALNHHRCDLTIQNGINYWTRVALISISRKHGEYFRALEEK